MSSQIYPYIPVLIVDDETEITDGYELILHSAGILNTRVVNDSRNVLDLIKAVPISAVLLDLYMPHMSGEEVLGEITRNYPDIPVFINCGKIACFKPTILVYFLSQVRVIPVSR